MGTPASRGATRPVRVTTPTRAREKTPYGPTKQGLSTEQFPVSAYLGSSKNLKDLKDLKENKSQDALEERC